MDLNFIDVDMNLYSCILAIANNQTTSGNLNYVVIGLIVIIVILVIVTMRGNK